MPVFTIGLGWRGIVSFTWTPTSWNSPEFVTPTSNAVSTEIVILVSVVVESWMSCGSTFVYASALPCRPLGVPPVEAPCTRCQIALIERAVYRSGFSTNTEAGAVRPSTPSDAIVACAVPWNRSFQIDVARLEPASPGRELLARRGLVVGVLRRTERVEQPLEAGDTQLERLDGVSVAPA